MTIAVVEGQGRCALGAHELVEAGRQHVATGRVREAMACFTRAADDPERGAEALSLLAAAYLLPGSQAPELALVHAHRAARHPAIEGEHLARCAAVALAAGDPALAEELAGRAGADGGGAAVALRATARLRLRDRQGVRDLLAPLAHADGPVVFWRRLVLEASAAGWLGAALTARRAMRAGGLRAPGLATVLLQASAAPLFLACLLGATVLAVALPGRVAAEAGIGCCLLAGLAVALAGRRV